MSERGVLRYSGVGSKEEAIGWVNAALELNSKTLSAETLFGDLSEYTVDMNVNIVETDDYIGLILDPLSGEGHDFNIRFDKKTRLITSMMVGSIDQDHEEVEG